MALPQHETNCSIQLDDGFGQTAASISEQSHTAEEFISNQLQLEADAREALPYQFNTCTKVLGPLRQLVFSCLTCNPPSVHAPGSYKPAGICYSCSISCHGEHELVELFNRRNFTCDCGTTRLPATSPCALRSNPVTRTRGGVHSEEPSRSNKYNQNFQNRFCGCGQMYDPYAEKGTMFQCLGLGTGEEGGCDEDWWHPECIVGCDKDWYKQKLENDKKINHDAQGDEAIANGHVNGNIALPQGHTTMETRPSLQHSAGEEEPPLPPGFPDEDAFEHMICYKCADAFPWIKRYAGSDGFLPAVTHGTLVSNLGHSNSSNLLPNNSVKIESSKKQVDERIQGTVDHAGDCQSNTSQSLSLRARTENNQTDSRKRKSDDGEEEKHREVETETKKIRLEGDKDISPCRWSSSPSPHFGSISLFLESEALDHFCRCANCFPLLSQHPQLLEQEETYEPPRSESSEVGSVTGEPGARSNSIGTRSLLDRGEAALSNMDRVRAIEGVMAYNHVRDKVKDFLKPFAESGQPVGAEDIKRYFEKLRGDDQAIKDARSGSGVGDVHDDQEGDGRREQRGY